MKGKFKSRKNQGIALLAVCIAMVLVTAVALGSYLTLVEYENAIAARSQAWNEAMVVAEAGIEEGMSLVNMYAGSGASLTGWPSSATADGWTQNGSTYTLTRYIGTAHYTVIVTNSGASATIQSTGTVPGPAVFAFGSGTNV